MLNKILLRYQGKLLAGLLLASSAGMASAGTIFYDFESGAQGWTVGGDATTSLGSSSIAPSWRLDNVMGGSSVFGLLTTWWVNPNIGNFGAERSYVTSPVIVADDTDVSISFDSYSSNEGGYPTYYDVEYIQISINSSTFTDVHGFTSLLHNYADQTFRNITFATGGITPGDQIQYRFLYDTGDGCCGPEDISGWAFDNVSISGVPSVPEPASLALLGLGLAGLGFTRRRKQA